VRTLTRVLRAGQFKLQECEPEFACQVMQTYALDRERANGVVSVRFLPCGDVRGDRQRRGGRPLTARGGGAAVNLRAALPPG